MFELAVAKVGIVFEMSKLLGEIFSEMGLRMRRELLFIRHFIYFNDGIVEYVYIFLLYLIESGLFYLSQGHTILLGYSLLHTIAFGNQ